MRCTILFLLACHLGSGLLGPVGVQRKTIQLRMAEPEKAPEEVLEAAPEVPEEAAPAKPGKYDVSKLVPSNQGAGFNQFDPVLTATQFLSRRFGIIGGLALFLGLAAIEGKEIVGSLLSTGPETGSGDVVTTASGLRYVDVLVGKGGSSPLPGYVIGLDAKVSIGDQLIFDTKNEKPIAFKYGTRPFQNVLCEGVEEGIQGMKVGGKRKLFVPKKLAPPGVDLPDGVPLVYDVELTEVLSGYF